MSNVRTVRRVDTKNMVFARFGRFFASHEQVHLIT